MNFEQSEHNGLDLDFISMLPVIYILQPRQNEPHSPNETPHPSVLLIPYLISDSQTSEDVEVNHAAPRRRVIFLIFPHLNDNDDGDEFHQILGRLFEMHQPQGAPPASASILDSLPEVIVDESSKCPICFEDFKVGSKVVQLPCRHLFDRDCIHHWLKQHATCPYCRYELPVDDPQYEKERKERMTSRAVNEDIFFHETKNVPPDSEEIPEEPTDQFMDQMDIDEALDPETDIPETDIQEEQQDDRSLYSNDMEIELQPISQQPQQQKEKKPGLWTRIKRKFFNRPQ